VTTARGTDTHGLSSLELSVGQGLAGSGLGLLDEPPLAVARRTAAQLVVGRDARTGRAQQILLALLAERLDQRSELLEGFEPGAAVFFPGPSP
jgi:hypothetical protein